MIRFASLIIRW